jgi:hypothetical protein
MNARVISVKGNTESGIPVVAKDASTEEFPVACRERLTCFELADNLIDCKTATRKHGGSGVV